MKVRIDWESLYADFTAGYQSLLPARSCCALVAAP